MVNQLNVSRNSRRWWVYGIVILIFSIVLTGCSGNNNSASNSNSSMELLSKTNSAPMEPEADFTAIKDQYGDSVALNNSTSKELTAAESEESAVGNSKMSVGATASDLSAYDRKLIYNANVVLEVENYGDAQTKLFDMVTLAGGYMLNFNDTMSSYESGGVFVIKVPSKGFHPFVSKLEELKKKDTKTQRNIEGKDVTEEYVDIASRLKAKQVVEGRLLDFMDKATDTTNLLQFSNQLALVQEEIEAIKGRMRYIDQNVAFSTVEIRMYEKIGKEQTVEEKSDNLLTRAGDAMKGSGEAVLAMFEGVFIVLAGALPILVVIAIIVVIIWFIYRKTRYNGPRQSSSYVTSVEKTDLEDHVVTPQDDVDKD